MCETTVLTFVGGLVRPLLASLLYWLEQDICFLGNKPSHIQYKLRVTETKLSISDTIDDRLVEGLLCCFFTCSCNFEANNNTVHPEDNPQTKTTHSLKVCLYKPTLQFFSLQSSYYLYIEANISTYVLILTCYETPLVNRKHTHLRASLETIFLSFPWMVFVDSFTVVMICHSGSQSTHYCLATGVCSKQFC